MIFAPPYRSFSMQPKFWKLLPSQRAINNPMFTFYSLESPWFHRPRGKWKMNLTRYDNFFNMSMTYRRDSDVFSPYATIYQIKILAWCSAQNQGDVPLTWNAILNKKCVFPESQKILNDHYKIWVKSDILGRKRERGVIGLISNCIAFYRSSFAKELNKRLNKVWVVAPSDFVNSSNVPVVPPIHSLEIYGQCAAGIQPGRNHHNVHHENSLDSLLNKNFSIWGKAGHLDSIKVYKFFLSIENSRCVDYITEKFFINGIFSKASLGTISHHLFGPLSIVQFLKHHFLRVLQIVFTTKKRRVLKL